MCSPKKATIASEIGIGAVNPNMDFLGTGGLKIGETVSSNITKERAKGRRQLRFTPTTTAQQFNPNIKPDSPMSGTLNINNSTGTGLNVY